MSKQTPESRHSKIRSQLVRFEIEALSTLLHFWAENRDDEQRPRAWRSRLPSFRVAVLKGLGEEVTRRGPRSHKIPPELVADERCVMLDMAQVICDECPEEDRHAIRKWLDSVEIPTTVDGCSSLTRSFPGPVQSLDSIARLLVGLRDPPASIAHEIVSRRLSVIRVETARKAPRVASKLDREQPRSRSQRVLASVLLDLCSYPPNAERLTLVARALDALCSSGYPPRMLYYLVQLAHKIPKEISIRLPPEQDIESLCAAVAGHHTSNRFGDLVKP